MEERMKKLEEEVCYLRKVIEELNNKLDTGKPVEFHYHYNYDYSNMEPLFVDNGTMDENCINYEDGLDSGLS